MFTEFTEGRHSLRTEATNVRELLAELEQRFPDLPPGLLKKSAVALDGEIITQPFLEPLDDNSKITFIGAMIGG